METYLLILNEGGIFIWALLGLALVGLLFILRTIIRRLRKTAPFLPDEPIYRTLIEQTLMGVAIVQNGQIVFTNPAVAQITGYTTDDFRAISVEEALANMIHQEDMPHLRQMMENVLTGKPVIPRAEYRFIRKDGSITWFMAEVSRIEYQRQPALQFRHSGYY
jgi:PAS domain S-box-containing protein